MSEPSRRSRSRTPAAGLVASGAPGPLAANASAVTVAVGGSPAYGLDLVPELRAALPEAMLALMQELTSTMFCVKDAAGRYVAVNETFVLRTNQRSARDVLGRRAGELFVPELAERYEEQDAEVLRSGTTLRNELELIRAPGGKPRWHLTAKVPLRDPGSGAVVGLVSMSQDVGADAVDDPALRSLTSMIVYLHGHLADPLRVADLAEVAGCSVDALQTRVRRVFHRSPRQLILTARIDLASTLLASSDRSLAEVATTCGFYDQAAFSRQVARLTGQTPAQFRRAARGE